MGSVFESVVETGKEERIEREELGGIFMYIRNNVY